MRYKQGDLVIVRFPFTDLTDFKFRPGLIVSNNRINHEGDYIIAMITSKNKGEEAIQLKSDDLESSLLDNAEPFVYCKKLAALNKSIISKKISSISNVDKKQLIINKIKSNFDL